VDPCSDYSESLYESLRKESLYFEFDSQTGENNNLTSVWVNLTFHQLKMEMINNTLFEPQPIDWFGPAPSLYHYIDIPKANSTTNSTKNYTLFLNLQSPDIFFTDVTVRTCDSAPNITGNISTSYNATLRNFPAGKRIFITLEPNANYESSYTINATLHEQPKEPTVLSPTVLIIVAVIGGCILLAITGGLVLYVWWKKRARYSYQVIG